MNGQEVFEVLQAKGILRLYHANSVTTSCTFLRQGALVSRGYAEANRLPQTYQYTDEKDKKYNVWNDVFLDTDDYHRRISDQNKYGPVVFMMDSQILTALPSESHVLVTRSNPSDWLDSQTHDDRYFSTKQQLLAGLSLGTMSQMLTIRTPNSLLPFGRALIEVVLDNPQQQLANQSDAFTSSMTNLSTAASSGSVTAPLRSRNCNQGCKCVGTYQSKWHHLQQHF